MCASGYRLMVVNIDINELSQRFATKSSATVIGIEIRTSDREVRTDPSFKIPSELSLE
jgi:hypothetical protein